MAFGKLKESADYRNVVRSVLADLRQARQVSLSTGRSVSFSVDLQKRSFGHSNRFNGRIPATVEVQAVVGDVTPQDQGVLTIVFLPEGGATGGRLDFLRPGGGGTRVRVDWLTGRIGQEPLL
jgi:general secretion pathway protein H